MEKPDDFTKILIATAAINYMANQLSVLRKNLLNFQPEEFNDTIGVINQTLAATVEKLGEVMNEMGELMNDLGIVFPIDEKATKAAFEIIIHGEDEV